jgi:hypothetical protein
VFRCFSEAGFAPLNQAWLWSFDPAGAVRTSRRDVSGEEERIQGFDSLLFVSLWQVKRRKRRAPLEGTFPA